MDGATISNWLFERHAFTVGRISVRSEEQANKTRINAMVKTYDRITAFTWSDKIKTILSNAEVDSTVSDIKSELCDTNGGPNFQSNEINVPSLEDVEFISCRLSVLLHAVKGAPSRLGCSASQILPTRSRATGCAVRVTVELGP